MFVIGSARRPPGLRAMALLLTCAVLAPVRRAAACDICAIYTATSQREARQGFWLGVAQQYSHFGTELENSHEVTLPADEHMDSSVTQFLVGYTVSPRFSLQLNVPFIIRYFRRIRDHQIQNGNQTGIGDLALTGNFLAYDRVTETSVFRFSLLGGVKFPSGNSAPLAEELPATVASVVARSRFPVARHTAGLPEPHASDTALPEEGGLHGHDIALGSGSYDGIVGGQIFWTYRRFFVGAALQYAIRGLGSFEYQFANDLSYIGGPGYYVLLTHDYTLGAQLVLSGETKGNDTQAGVKANDTAMTSLYVGPGVSFTWGTSLAADVAIDVPVYQHETSLQLVPDVRVRGGLTWRF